MTLKTNVSLRVSKLYTKFKVINHAIVNNTHQIYLEEIVDSE
jgi:hypothetical protein